MKFSVKSTSILFSVLVAIFSFVFIINTSAQDPAMDNQQLDKIRDNCVSVKNTLNQLHSSDALLRVNRGQTYELMSTKLMSGFNSRLSNNGYTDASSKLSVITKNYNSTLSDFRQNYRLYEEQMTYTIAIDCKNKPKAFYDATVLSREKRMKLHENIIKLNQHVAEYQSELLLFEKNYNKNDDGDK